LTVGELAEMFNREFSINCELEVVKMDNWAREDFYDETDAPWVMPSPNMPTVDTAVVFPATVYFEGIQISEGRGTTRPFEIVGAPYIDSREYSEALTSLKLPGVIFRPIEFLPTFQKHAGKACGGVFLHVADRNLFEPVFTGVAMIKTAFDLYREEFQWKNPPYEYVFDRNPFDVIAGTTKIREMFEENAGLEELKSFCRSGVGEFNVVREKYFLY
jgi:uncharacterized protein YbbC (DUF1343 family)